MIQVTQSDRQRLLDGELGSVGEYRKTATIVATKMVEEFTVETDRGVMTGKPGDYLVTNHPDDDSGSDLWTISRERMAATYESV